MGSRWLTPNAGGGGVGSRVRSSFSGQTIAITTTATETTDIEFSSANSATDEFDTDAWHSLTTNPENFTVPSGKAGLYVISGSITMANADGNTNIILRLELNTGAGFSFIEGATAFLTQSSDSNLQGKLNVSSIRELDAGDIIKLSATAGQTAINATAATISIVRLGDDA